MSEGTKPIIAFVCEGSPPRLEEVEVRHFIICGKGVAPATDNPYGTSLGDLANHPDFFGILADPVGMSEAQVRLLAAGANFAIWTRERDCPRVRLCLGFNPDTPVLEPADSLAKILATLTAMG